MDIRQHPSPNHGPRKSAPTDMVILHYTVLDEAESLERLCDPAHEVSAHYLIAEDGRVAQLVEEDRRAWHAGRSYWAGERDVNSRSIGIELVNDGAAPFPNTQIAALIELLLDISARYALSPDRILGHSDVAPGRKSDPGPLFPWEQLALSGLAVSLNHAAKGTWPGNGRARFLAALIRAGYDPDTEFDTLLDVFRLRFRPQALGDGPSLADLTLAEELADRHPAIDRRAPVV